MSLLLIKKNQLTFLILAFFILGLLRITSPPIDDHAWRQTLTISIAKNMLEHPNLLYPRMDIGGATEGIIAGEFPALNSVMWVFYKVFGYQHWYGRLINWTLSCLALFSFSKIITRISNKEISFYATCAFAASVTYMYARKSMPDAFAMSMMLFGTARLIDYLDCNKKNSLFFAFLLISIGVLSKIPFAIVLTLLFPVILEKKSDKDLLIKTFVVVSLSITIGLVWYFYWVPTLLENYHNQLMWPYSFTDGWKAFVNYLPDAWDKLSFRPFHNYLVTIVSFIGMVLYVKNNSYSVKLMIVLYTILFFIYIIKTGDIFPTHVYYIIPFTPIYAIGFGYCISYLIRNHIVRHSVTFLLLSYSLYQIHLSTRAVGNNERLLGLSQITDQYIEKQEKIMINSGAYNPIPMFFAERRGWAVNDDVVYKINWMPDFKKDGLNKILFIKKPHQDTLPFLLIYEDEFFAIYKP